MNWDIGRTRQWACVLSFAITLVVNALASSGAINGVTPDQISDSFDVYLIPAGYAFSIWGIIYLALLAFVVFQALRVHRDDRLLDRIGGLFVITNLANAVWILLYHYSLFWLSLVVMAILLISLIRIAALLQFGSTRAPWGRLIFVHIPFGVYLGWISIATVANVVQTLDAAGYTGTPFGAEIWAVIVLAVVVGLSLFMSFRTTNLPHAAVLVWALVAVAVAESRSGLVLTAVWISIALVVAGFLVAVAVRRRSPPIVV